MPQRRPDAPHVPNASLSDTVGAGEEPGHRFTSVTAETLSRRTTRELIASIIQGHYGPILAATGNRPFRSLLRTIEPALLAARTVSLTTRRAGLKRSAKEHRAIVDAIRERSAARARRAMTTHLSWTANLSVDRLDGARAPRSRRASS
jgi:hypothetical protein